MKFWPFGKGEQSFEKVLSELSSKIQANETTLYALQVRCRRWKGLFTLYAGVAYVFYLMFIILLIGWRYWSAYTALGIIFFPGFIVAGRFLLNWYYERRIRNIDSQLEALRAEQREKVEDLKTKTNFYSTQSLLDRYGGSSSSTPTREDQRTSSARSSSPRLRKRPSSMEENFATPSHTPERTGPRPKAEHFESRGDPNQRLQEQISNAVSGSSQTIPADPVVSGPPKWYDRILDVLVGEDENRPQNRFALICRLCGTHNGLAPPGESDVARIRYICPRCGTMNGREPPALQGLAVPSKENSKSSDSEVKATEEFREEADEHEVE